MFGVDVPVFLVNKNLQCLPRKLKGCLVWLKELGIIATVMRCKEPEGMIAFLRVMFPVMEEAKKSRVVDLRSVREGFFLEQILGPKVARDNNHHTTAATTIITPQQSSHHSFDGLHIAIIPGL